MAAIVQTTFSTAFSSIKIVFRLKFAGDAPKGPIGNKSALVQVMAWLSLGPTASLAACLFLVIHKTVEFYHFCDIRANTLFRDFCSNIR